MAVGRKFQRSRESRADSGLPSSSMGPHGIIPQALGHITLEKSGDQLHLHDHNIISENVVHRKQTFQRRNGAI